MSRIGGMRAALISEADMCSECPDMWINPHGSRDDLTEKGTGTDTKSGGTSRQKSVRTRLPESLLCLLLPPSLLLLLPFLSLLTSPSSHASLVEAPQGRGKVQCHHRMSVFFLSPTRPFTHLLLKSHILVSMPQPLPATLASQNMLSLMVNLSTRSSTVYSLSMLPVPVEATW